MILDELAAYAAYRVEEAKKKLPPEEIRTQAEHLPKGDFRFEKALKKKGMSFICEVKKASPSKGVIAEEFPYTEPMKQQVRTVCPYLRSQSGFWDPMIFSGKSGRRFPFP